MIQPSRWDFVWCVRCERGGWLVSVLIVIDGLESTLPVPEKIPVWERLAATGRTGRLHCLSTPYFALFGHAPLGQVGGGADLPLGYATALALADGERQEWPDPERIWCCLGFTHLYKKQNDLLFLSAERTGQSVAECRALLEAVLPDLQEAGWLLYPLEQSYGSGGEVSSMRGWVGGKYFVFSRAAPQDLSLELLSLPLDALEGHSFRDHSPSGTYAPTLLQLLTVGQLILARHPVNRQRQQAGRVTLNTPWIWGVGSGMKCAPVRPAQGGCCWTTQPVLAGLARASGYRLATLDEEGDFAPLVTAACAAMATGGALIHLSLPAVLARHGLLEERQTFLQRLNDQLLEPLTHMLARTAESLLITSLDPLTAHGQGAAPASGPGMPWVMARGGALLRKRRFWHWGRPGVGEVLNPAQFWSLCGR